MSSLLTVFSFMFLQNFFSCSHWLLFFSPLFIQNSTSAPIKRSNMDRATNLQILFLFAMLMIMAFFSSLGSYLWTSKCYFWYYEFMPFTSDGSIFMAQQTQKHLISCIRINYVCYIMYYGYIPTLGCKISSNHKLPPENKNSKKLAHTKNSPHFVMQNLLQS